MNEHGEQPPEQMEMPRYKCHKEVWALKIAAIRPFGMWGGSGSGTGFIPAVQGGYGATIDPVDDGYAPFNVTQEYLDRHQPQVGGYYVIYKEGYQSYSPAKAFEDGYTRI